MSQGCSSDWSQRSSQVHFLSRLFTRNQVTGTVPGGDQVPTKYLVPVSQLPLLGCQLYYSVHLAVEYLHRTVAASTQYTQRHRLPEGRRILFLPRPGACATRRRTQDSLGKCLSRCNFCPRLRLRPARDAPYNLMGKLRPAGFTPPPRHATLNYPLVQVSLTTVSEVPRSRS